uniref:BTB domain-containing protein n=1 Tax=Timema genevievae TaxID=629358 RepID=A0A7R9JVR4_TIMGE|nr:unnamed protein product [Timema genevievae]
MVSSDVWRFCTRLTNNNVKCNHCGRVMSYHGTTNLRVHIARHFGIRPQRNLFGRILKGNIQLPPLVSKDQNHLDITSGRNKQHSDLLAVKQELQDSVTRPHSPILPSSSKHPMEVCLRWFTYQTNMQDALPIMLLNEQFVDVTLAAEGQSVKCHKVILSACSPYFEKLLSENPCEHPIIIMKDLKFSHIQALVDFMYNGEVNVIENELPSLLAAAKTLQIKGLAEAKTRLPFGDVPPIKNIPLQICLNESVSNVAHPISPSQKSRVDKFKKEFDDCADPSAFDFRNPEEQETVHTPENLKENDCSLESKSNKIEIDSCSSHDLTVSLVIEWTAKDWEEIGGSNLGWVYRGVIVSSSLESAVIREDLSVFAIHFTEPLSYWYENQCHKRSCLVRTERGGSWRGCKNEQEGRKLEGL